jgi:hypothetical protein
MTESIQKRIKSFTSLGERIVNILNNIENHQSSPAETELIKAVTEAENNNPWFTRENIISALTGIAGMLENDKIENWLSDYQLRRTDIDKAREIAVIMAGNIPLVGFHDFMSVLLSGHKFLGKLSSQDRILPVKLAELLKETEPGWEPYISFTEERITGFDAVIATGSNNSARYFQYYFGKYPHIIRKNRNSLAIIQGNETPEELRLLSDDIFMYFGMGCRSVSKIMIPANYDLEKLISPFEKWNHFKNHNKYCNNYEYHKAIYLVNKEQHLDNGFLLLKEDKGLASPLAVLYYDRYETLDDVKKYIESNKEQIQCVAFNGDPLIADVSTVRLGETQTPGPEVYADRMDTLKFLLSL